MTDKETRIKVDISFNMTGGQLAANIIQVSTVQLRGCYSNCCWVQCI